MVRVGITGHQALEKRLREGGAGQTEENAWVWVADAFASFLDSIPAKRAIAVSSLAVGADQRLSAIVLEHGGQIEAIVPSRGYIETFDGADHSEYERLLAQAVEVISLDYPEPSEEAYFAAGKIMADRADTIVAVWDGKEAEGLGGTGDVVAYALGLDCPVLQLDPIRRAAKPLSGKE